MILAGIVLALLGVVLVAVFQLPLVLMPLLLLLAVPLFILGLVARLVYVATPNELLVITGRRRRLSDGRVVGYRVVRSGRAIRMPMIERVDRLGLETILLQLQVAQAYTRGGAPVSLTVTAAVKFSTEEEALARALERFLGQDRSVVRRVAQNTVEGTIRAILTDLSPDELQQDRARVMEMIREELEAPMASLGLVVDDLQLGDISLPG